MISILNSDNVLFPASRNRPSKNRLAGTVLVVLGAVSLSACTSKEAGSGQSLVRVGKAEITVHQLNDELSRIDSPTEVAKQQVLEVLIDRQLLQSEAMRNKMDRDPEVLQAIERAKAQILAQAYLKSKSAGIAPPSKDEIREYFTQHPELFTRRKLFDIEELIIDSKDFSSPLHSAVDAARSLDSVAAWLDQQGIEYARRKTARSTADLPPELAAKLQAIQKGDLFVVKEDNRTMLGFLNDLKETPVAIEAAEKQIEQYLINKRRHEAGAAEIKHLRSLAEIEYLNKTTPVADHDKRIDQASESAAKDNHMTRGVAGLK